MTTLVTWLLILFILLYVVILAAELLRTRDAKSFAIQGGILAILVIVLRLTTGFPETQRSFGGIEPVGAIGVMFLCTLLGIAARYAFHLKGRFSVRAFVKPLVISPIVLLPLIGSVHGATLVEPIQLISFAFIAFQNGFFWNVVLQHARTEL
jgi:hypothetical protein